MTMRVHNPGDRDLVANIRGRWYAVKAGGWLEVNKDTALILREYGATFTGPEPVKSDPLRVAAEAQAAALKGSELTDELKRLGLSTGGSVAAKRARLVEAAMKAGAEILAEVIDEGGAPSDPDDGQIPPVEPAGENPGDEPPAEDQRPADETPAS